MTDGNRVPLFWCVWAVTDWVQVVSETDKATKNPPKRVFCCVTCRITWQQKHRLLVRQRRVQTRLGLAQKLLQQVQ